MMKTVAKGGMPQIPGMGPIPGAPLRRRRQAAGEEEGLAVGQSGQARRRERGHRRRDEAGHERRRLRIRAGRQERRHGVRGRARRVPEDPREVDLADVPRARKRWVRPALRVRYRGSMKRLGARSGRSLCLPLRGRMRGHAGRSADGPPRNPDAPPVAGPGAGGVSPALGLVNLWRVAGAEGEDADTWLRLDAQEFQLWRDCGMITGSWKAVRRPVPRGGVGHDGRLCDRLDARRAVAGAVPADTSQCRAATNWWMPPDRPSRP